MAFRDVRRKESGRSDALWDTPCERGWTVGIAARTLFSTAVSVAEEGGVRLVTDVQKADGPLSPARYCEDWDSGFRQVLFGKWNKTVWFVRLCRLSGKIRGYGGDRPGEHPNDSGRTQNKTQSSRSRYCCARETRSCQPKGKEIPPSICQTPEECARVCAKKEARSIINVSKAEKERGRRAVEGRRGLIARKDSLIPNSPGMRAVLVSLCVTVLPA